MQIITVDDGELGTVYLLHLDKPLAGHASHYIGWAKQLEARLKHHRSGTGARFTRAANIAGIEYSIAADWPGTKNLERAMKRNRNHKEFCPICMAKEGKKPKDPLAIKFKPRPDVYGNKADSNEPSAIKPQPHVVSEPFPNALATGVHDLYIPIGIEPSPTGEITGKALPGGLTYDDQEKVLSF